MSSTKVELSNHGEVTENGNAILYFWAEWCGPCKQFGPVYENVSEEFPDVTFAKIDVDENQDLAAAYKVSSIPSLVFYRDGEIVHAQAGAMASTDLRASVKRLESGKRP